MEIEYEHECSKCGHIEEGTTDVEPEDFRSDYD